MRVLQWKKLIFTFLQTIQSHTQSLVNAIFTTMLAQQPTLYDPVPQVDVPAVSALHLPQLAQQVPQPSVQAPAFQSPPRLAQLPPHLPVHQMSYTDKQWAKQHLRRVHAYANKIGLPIEWAKWQFRTLRNVDGTPTRIEPFLTHGENFGRRAAKRWRAHNAEALREAMHTRPRAGAAKAPKPNTNKLRLLATKLRALLVALDPPQEQPVALPPLPTTKPLTESELNDLDCPFTLDTAKEIPAHYLVLYTDNGAKFIFDIKPLWRNLFRQPADQCDRTDLTLRDNRNPNTRQPFRHDFIEFVKARMRLLKQHDKVADENTAPPPAPSPTATPSSDTLRQLRNDIVHLLSQAGFLSLTPEMMERFCNSQSTSQPALKRWYEEAARLYHYPNQFPYATEPRGRELLTKFDRQYNRWVQQFEGAHLEFEALHTMHQLLELFDSDNSACLGGTFVIGCMTLCSEEMKQVFPNEYWSVQTD